MSPDGVYFTLRPAANVASAILFRDFASGKTREILRLDRRIAPGLALSPDGRYLLFSPLEREGSDLMLVEGFE